MHWGYFVCASAGVGVWLVLTVEGLTVNYGSNPAVAGVSLTIEHGEALGLVGESGCGKSTIAKALLNLLPDGCTVGGRVICGGKIGLIFQDPMTRLNPLLTVMAQGLETVRAHAPRMSRRQAELRVRESLHNVRLEGDRADQYPHQLSGGQRQRVMIALTLLIDPLILIADEPTTSLDITVAQAILKELDQLRRERGMGLILISHDLGLVARYCDRLAVMHRGTIVEMGAVNQVLSTPRHEYTKYLLASLIVWGAQRPTPVTQTTTQTREPLLSVRHLYKTYRVGWGKVIRAVDDINLDIWAGESFGLIGESGSGKSTLARLILRLMPSDRGSIQFVGVNLTHIKPLVMARLRPQMQMIFQDPRACFHPYLSVLASVRDALTAYQTPRQQAEAEALAMLARVGIDPSMARRYPKELSGGQLQRAAIARALILKPRFLICDEPVSMLDVPIQRQVLELLIELQEECHLTYLFITHDLAVAQFFCDRIAVMQGGKILEQGTRNEIFDQPQHPYTQTLLADFPHL